MPERPKGICLATSIAVKYSINVLYYAVAHNIQRKTNNVNTLSINDLYVHAYTCIYNAVISYEKQKEKQRRKNILINCVCHK